VAALRSKGNVLETCPSQPSFPWSQVLDGTVFDPTLGEDVASLSQCEVVSLSQAVSETPKWNVVIHGAEIVGPVACLSFTYEGVHGGSNRGGARVGFGTGECILPCPLKQEDLNFFDKAREPEHQETLWSLPSVYETLEEMEQDGTYFLPAYAVMDPKNHPMNTSKAPDWTEFPELSHRAVYEDSKRVARKLGLVQAAARYR
jgi:hypothetical protein